MKKLVESISKLWKRKKIEKPSSILPSEDYSINDLGFSVIYNGQNSPWVVSYREKPLGAVIASEKEAERFCWNHWKNINGLSERKNRNIRDTTRDL